MRLGKAEYQNRFNAEKTVKKSYKTRGRTSDFFGRDAADIDFGTGVRYAARASEHRAQNHHRAR